MEQIILYDNAKYIYQVSVSYGGIILRLYTCEEDAVLNYTAIINYSYSPDLQGCEVFDEKEKASISKLISAQNVFIKDEVHSQVLQVNDNLFLVQGPTKAPGFQRQIKHILYSLTEKNRQIKKGECTIHAAAVEMYDKKSAVLILGDKGSGKTITSLCLCNIYGGRLIGNDLVIIGKESSGKLYAHGGAPNITIRKDITRKLFPELDTIKPSKCNYPPIHGMDYEDKISFEPSELNIKTSLLKMPLKLIVRVNVHPSAVKNSITENFKKDIESLRLHENFARFIRAQTTPVFLEENGSIAGFYNSQDCTLAQNLRNGIINSLLQTPFVYLMAKSPQDSAKLIINKFSELI